MNKRESKGMLGFVFISLLVLAIGILMKIFGKIAFGYTGGSRFYPNDKWVLLTGDGVIILGVLLLIFAVFLYLTMNNNKNG